MKPLLRPLKILGLVIVFTAVAPFLMAKFNYFGESRADTIDFARAYPKIEYSSSPSSYAEAVNRASPAVVSIHATHEIKKEAHPYYNDPFFRHFFGDPRGQGNMMPESRPSLGSGVIISKNGIILTNNHVVKDADEIEVKLSDGRTAKAKVEGSDPDSDLAILKIELDDLPVIGFGDSDNLKVGDVVLAIGNPFGVGQTVTQGIVSATQRNELGINTFESFIQTDAAINPGNSGGALIDANGNLVGINNAIYTRSGGYQGIGFAIPVSLAKEIMNELISEGHVTRGWLGITVRGLNEELRKTLKYPEGDGAVIAGVIRNGPAAKAGIMPGDIVVNVNGKQTKEPSDVLSATSVLKPDEAYNLSVVRDGEIFDFKVIIGKRPTSTN